MSSESSDGNFLADLRASEPPTSRNAVILLSIRPLFDQVALDIDLSWQQHMMANTESRTSIRGLEIALLRYASQSLEEMNGAVAVDQHLLLC